jgi:hypothetical protein
MPELKEVSFIGQLEVVQEHRCVNVRTHTRILRDGVQASPDTYHRHVLTKDSDLSEQDPLTQAVAQAAFAYWATQV